MCFIKSTLVFVFCVSFAFSQDIIATVKVDAGLIQNLEKQIFEDMEQNIKQFVNNRKWTTDKFGTTEKIKMNILVKLTDQVSLGKYKGSVQIQSSRPIFNTSYESIMLNFLDRDFNIDYQQFQTIEFNDNTYITNLGSILAFYAYVVLALDYDSFSKLGGNIYLDKALQTLNNAQQKGDGAWETNSGQNSRYWFFENLNSPQFKDFREATYLYHRLGFDTMQKNAKDGKAEESRAKMLDALSLLKKCNDVRPSSTLLRTYFNTKETELVSIFQESSSIEKARIYELLRVMDPTNLDKYEKLK